jgi:tRNA(adenine34) deaminase
VPIGAVVVHSGEIVGRGHNHCIRHRDPSAHAEILALRQAGQHFGDWRREGCTLYVTLEPCPMCMGASLNGRVQRIVYATPEPKAGACGSIVDLRAPPGFNHHIIVESGLCQDEASSLLKSFFRDLRKAKQRTKTQPQAEGCPPQKGP